MELLDILHGKRIHLERLANRGGAEGEAAMLSGMRQWVPRPKGIPLKVLMSCLANRNIKIKRSSFDAICLPEGITVDFNVPSQVYSHLEGMVFVEIKSANQARVKPGFGGFFFALTESEIYASEVLGHRHRVALYNKITGEVKITSVQEILRSTRSLNWQVSVQL